MNSVNDSDQPKGILLNLQMICDELDELPFSCSYTVKKNGDNLELSSCRLWYPGCNLSEHNIYILSEENDEFPVDRYPFISIKEREGTAPHICISGWTLPEVMDRILQIFQRYHEFESAMNTVITRDGSLDDLSRIGSDFFHNPLYIHDNMFNIMAMPKQVYGMLKFERNEETGELHIPMWLVNDFKFDDSYQKTFTFRRAGLWGNDQYPFTIRTLYVNLWEGNYYYGRLLINEIESSLKPGQFRMAEIFAEYCKMVIRRDIRRSQKNFGKYEETLLSLVKGEQIRDSDMKNIMETLSWQKKHRFLCLKFISQDSGISVRSDDSLRSSLSLQFQRCPMFFYEHSLCMIMNLDLLQIDYFDAVTQLSPVVRDNCVYCGMSDPVSLGPDIYNGFKQTDIALDFIRNNKTTSWLVRFSDCVMDYILKSFDTSIPKKMLVPPVLDFLRRYDSEKGTEFFKTLKVYILNERSIPKTSAALFIHRTTLLYRLEKMNTIYPINLNDPSIRLHLQLAFNFIEEERESSSWDAST